MSNVLPSERKTDVWRMYRARLAIAFSLVLIGAAALSAFAMAPSFIVLSISSEAAAPASLGATDAADRSAIAQSQILLKTLSPLLAATTTPTDAIGVALSARPKNISITHITYTASAPSSLIIEGSASTPGDIKTYQEALQADPHFSSASVPVGDLVGAENGNFSITLSGNF